IPQRWRGWASLDSWPNVQELCTNERCKLREITICCAVKRAWTACGFVTCITKQSQLGGL
ncbi:hypothetical protein PanWU01x14_076390, partial [Parasponia andersonii]